MIADVNNIFIIFLLVSMSGFSHEHDDKSEVTKDGSYLMADVLKSLLKLNEARYKTLKKLNKINTGYTLRTSTENGFDFSSLLNKLKHIFDLLTIKPSLEKHDANVKLFDIFYDNNYILTIPIPTNSDENKRKHTIENVLRTRPERTASNEYTENMNDISSDDNEINSCGRGKLRCYFACKEAYRKSCLTRPCEYSFLKEMRRLCKEECEDRFY